MTSPSLVNMTPHDIVLLNDTTVILELPPSGNTIRLDQTDEMVDDLMISDHQIEIVHTVFESAVSLPEILPNTFYIVSALVANAYPERFDFLIVARTVRDENGRIKGCTAFARASP